MYYNELAGKDKIQAKKLREALPKEMAAFKEMRMPALHDGALSAKTKELIALSIGVAEKCESCIVAHTAGVISLGVTREEVVDALSVCLFMGGGPGLTYAAKALDCYDELLEEYKRRKGIK